MSSGGSSKPHRRFRLPKIGHRMTKTAVAVFICLLIYIARGYHGMPGESAVAAIICMQPYTSDSKWTAVHRVISTVLGGIWGLLFLLLMQALPGISSHMVTVYLIMSAGVLLALYSCVALNIAPSAALAAIVYICIIISYPDVDEPLIQTFDRILDTTIGVCVAVAVNGIHLAVIKHPEKIFFLQLKEIGRAHV